MASRSCGLVSPARNLACSGVSLCTWTSTSSRSAFWRLIRSTRTLPATSRISRKPRPGFDRLLLAGVACEHHLGAVPLRELQDVMGLARGQHPRLVHHDQGLAADLHLLLGGELQQLVDAVGTRVAVVAQRHRRPPGHGGRHDVVAVLLVKVGDGPESGGLARARRALDHRHASALDRGVADRQRLLLAQRITVQPGGSPPSASPPLSAARGRCRQPWMTPCPRTACSRPQVVACGIDLGVGHPRQ